MQFAGKLDFTIKSIIFAMNLKKAYYYYYYALQGMVGVEISS